ncbi:glycine zipper family protein [Palleronia sp. KMU-117]|uniref:glycine zipper family protein n=1 Tax=Palleronia sp. KMU-117 TaxID=3434108 RepID=UPI003D70AE79
MKPICLAVFLPAVLAACADSGADYTPLLDGPPNAAFQADLSACQRLARDQRQFDQETAGATVLGAGAGALLGAADDDADAAGGAIVGALAGGAAGAVHASERREAIVVECLRGRGHPVVG